MNTRLYVVLPILILLLTPATAQLKPDGLNKQLTELISGKRAQVGVAVIINGKNTITLNNDVRYPMMSVFKFHQALAVAHLLEQRKLPLTTSIHIEKTDLPTDTYSPLRDKYPGGEITMPIGELLTYTLQLSDNNACDILFDYAGGVKQTDDYIRSLGIGDFSIWATEAEMHRDLQLCYRNWTTPLAAARLLEIFVTRPVLTDSNRSFIERTMIECATGKDRLPKPLLETKAVIGHKTGTGDCNAKGQIIGTNDIGFVTLPDGQRYTITVFIKDSEESPQATAQIIADISRAVYHYVSGTQTVRTAP